MENRRRLRPLAALAAACLMAGCGAPHARPSSSAGMTLGPEGSRAYDAALAVLSGLHLPLATTDRSAGLIQCRPLAAGQWFEVWRRDQGTPRRFLEANLHSLRRTVTVQIQESEANRWHVDCSVRVERLSVPSRPVTSTSQIYRRLTDSEPTMQRLDFTDAQKRAMTWIDLGRDPALEERLLRAIRRHLEGP